MEISIGLKLSIQKTKIMASGPITSWEIDGETMETVIGYIFWGSKATAHGDCEYTEEHTKKIFMTQITMMCDCKAQRTTL